MPRKMGHTLPGVPYTDPWHERWQRLFGVKPNVTPVRTERGVQYRFVYKGRPTSTLEIWKDLPVNPNYRNNMKPRRAKPC